MGLSKSDFMEIRIQAETSEEHWESLPEEYKEIFEVKRVEVVRIKGEDAKTVYKRDKKWKAKHKEMIEAIQERTKREEEIRTDLRIKK